MKKLLLLFTTLLTVSSYSQISYEKGYYIDNSGQKTECFIKNNDWLGDPTDFKYRLSESDDIKTNNIDSVKEFGIYGITKYIRETVEVEISSEDINDMSYDMNPKFKQTQLFLKVLIESKANLYSGGGSSVKYFYNVDGSKIEQLVLKSYKNSENQIVENNMFRKQLFDNLKCSLIDIKNLLKLKYNENSLVNLFSEYNKCSNANIVDYTMKKKKDVFNLTLRPRINSSSLSINNSESKYRSTDFGKKTTFGFGIETEFILPFNKNKWSILIEPTYQIYDVETTKDATTYTTPLKAEATYKYLEIPVGLRHYFFLNSNSKIFINASLVFAVAFNSQIQYKIGNIDYSTPLEINNTSNIAFGIGYKFHNKYSIEMRYNTSRKILLDYNFWDSDYKTTSIILGYTLF
ncbi:outer membrane beta-barrel protein [Flavobacterium aestuarii]|uniref:outer membrane beta-barrel protein n=1 Tax=Flavobacterium aestuarii TaxID=3149227 RepID=UPI0032B41332